VNRSPTVLLSLLLAGCASRTQLSFFAPPGVRQIAFELEPHDESAKRKWVVNLDPSGMGSTTVKKLHPVKTDVHAKIIRSGNPSFTRGFAWLFDPVSFTEANFVEVHLSDLLGEVGQYALVTYQTKSVRLDVLQNQKFIGTTEFKRTIKPNTQYEIRWVRGKTTVCQKKIELPYNIKHTYQCDPESGEVTEPN